MPAWPGSGESPLLGCRLPTLVPSHGDKQVVVTLRRALIPFRGAPPSCPHLVTLASQRPRLLIPSLWRVEFQPMNWGGDADIPSMAMVLFKHLLPQGAPLRKQQAVPDKGIKLAEMGQHHRDSLGHLLTAKCPRTRHRTECQCCPLHPASSWKTGASSMQDPLCLKDQRTHKTELGT